MTAFSHRRTRSRGTVAVGTPAKRTVVWVKNNYLLVALFGALLLAFLAEMPWVSRAARTCTLQAATLTFVCLLAASGPFQEDLRVAVRRGPNPPLIALLLWCGFSAALSPFRTFAAAELLRMILCAAVYFAAAYTLRPGQLRIAVGGTIALGACVAVYGFLDFSHRAPRGAEVIVSVFSDHQNLGSFLVLLLPVAVALALNRSPKQAPALGYQAAVLVLGGALLLSRTRSAWIGAAAALLVLSCLFLRYVGMDLSRRGRPKIVGPLVILTLSFVLLVGAGGIAPLVAKRADTMKNVMEDPSFSGRLYTWRAAARAASERPFTGWGLGSWPVLQARWTHQGVGVRDVVARGHNYTNSAHNLWIQWAAETGGVGLLLYVAVVAAFVHVGLRALPTVSSKYRKTLLMGCIAAAAAFVVDAIGSPAYVFPGVASLPWLWMGLGVCACREARGGGGGGGVPALARTPSRAWLGVIAVGMIAAAAVLGFGYKLRSDEPVGFPWSASRRGFKTPLSWCRRTKPGKNTVLLASRHVLEFISVEGIPSRGSV